MAANKRTDTTSFTLKDVLIVITTMLTAIVPLITNDYRIGNIQTQLNSTNEEAKLSREQYERLSADVYQLRVDVSTGKLTGNNADKDIKVIEGDLNGIKERLNTVQFQDVYVLKQRVDKLEQQKSKR